MNQDKINTYLFNPKTWNGISITDNAIKQILFLINLNNENKGIKLGVKKSGCAGFSYTMKLITTKKINESNNIKEINFFYKKILVYISLKDLQILEGVEIDFVKRNINKIFKFSNSKLKNFCGCGESFSLK